MLYEVITWEIVMCEEKILSQAEEYGLWEEKEFYKLLIHSILHIIGYDHEKDNDYVITSYSIHYTKLYDSPVRFF